VSPAYAATARLWRYPGPGGWHFLTLPPDVSEQLRLRAGALATPGGAVPVVAAIGEARWETSVFYDRKRDAYLLPVKAPVRRQAGIAEGDEVRFTVEVEA
jgi:hypothetical protein